MGGEVGVVGGADGDGERPGLVDGDDDGAGEDDDGFDGVGDVGGDECERHGAAVERCVVRQLEAAGDGDGGSHQVTSSCGQLAATLLRII